MTRSGLQSAETRSERPSPEGIRGDDVENHPVAGDKKTADGPPRMIGYADEAACYVLPSVGFTWARKGQTPVLRDGDRDAHLSVSSLLTATGDVHIRFKTVAIRVTISCDFYDTSGRRTRRP